MLDEWIGNATAKMRINQVRQQEVAAEMGVTKNYLSMILNGKRKPANGREAVEGALDTLIARKNRGDK